MSCIACELYLIKIVILKNDLHETKHTVGLSKTSHDYQLLLIISIPKVIINLTNNSVILMNYEMCIKQEIIFIWLWKVVMILLSVNMNESEDV